MSYSDPGLTFTGQIPLNTLSVTADVTVKVIDSSLELYVNDEANVTFRDLRGQRSNECHS